MPTVVYDESPSMFRQAPVWFVFWSILSLVGVGLLVLGGWWLRTKNTRLVLTNESTTVTTGLLSKTTSEVRHRDVRNVLVQQSFMQRLMGVGSIGISSAGQGGFEIAVNGMPRPNEVRDVINRHRN